MKAVQNFWINPVFTRRNVIVLLGGSGSGKETQARAISEWLKIPHVSTGELLRREAASATPLGLRVKMAVNAGGLVEDDLMEEVVMRRLRHPDCRNGFILDGYPRNVRQAVTFEGNLPMSDRQIVIDLVANPDAYQVTCERLTRLYKRMGVYHPVRAARPVDQISHEIRRLLEHAMFELPSPERIAAA